MRSSLYIDSKGVHTFSSAAEKRTEGIQIATTFFCEAGHQWDEVREFCDGNTMESIRRGPDHDQSDEQAPRTI